MQLSELKPTQKAWSAQTTTNTYADLGMAWDKAHLKTCTMVLENTGANGANAKVLGSVDGGTTYDVEIQAEAAIAAGAKLVVRWSDYYTHIKVQIKAQVADAQTTVAARAAGVPV